MLSHVWHEWLTSPWQGVECRSTRAHLGVCDWKFVVKEDFGDRGQPDDRGAHASGVDAEGLEGGNRTQAVSAGPAERDVMSVWRAQPV